MDYVYGSESCCSTCGGNQCRPDLCRAFDIEDDEDQEEEEE